MYYGCSANATNVVCEADLSSIYLAFFGFTSQLSSNLEHLGKTGSPNRMPVSL
jgi:hypothetical protein